MKKLIFVISMIVASLLTFSKKSFALTLTLSGTEIKVEYNEPTTNADGTSLMDLDKTTIYYDKGQGTVKAGDILTTRVTGGGTINTTVTIPITNGQEADVSVWATATDKSSNESAKSNIGIIRIDRLPPSPPN